MDSPASPHPSGVDPLLERVDVLIGLMSRMCAMQQLLLEALTQEDDEPPPATTLDGDEAGQPRTPGQDLG